MFRDSGDSMTNRIFAITTYHTSNKAVEAAEEWKRLGICAIGWSEINFCSHKSRYKNKSKSKEEIKKRLKNKNYDTRGSADIWNFISEVSEGDIVLAYSRRNTIAYVGEAKGPCRFNRKNSIGNPNGKFTYSHQRDVKWWDEPHYFNRHDFPKYFADQFGKRGVTVTEIFPNSKGFKGFIDIIKTCANSGSQLPGINEDTIKAGLVKYLYSSLEKLEKGLTITKVEVAIGKQKKISRPDFIAKDRQGKPVIIECKGSANEAAVEQIQSYEKEYGKDKDPRLLIVAFRINDACRLAARKAGNVELYECDLTFRRIR